MNDYEGLHVTFDQYDTEVALHCLRCNKIIARRDEVPTKNNPNVAFHALVRAAHYREVYAKLSDGSVAYLPFCSDCVSEEVDKEKAMAAIKRAWEAAMIHAHRPQEAIDDLHARTDSLQIVQTGAVIKKGSTLDAR